VEIVRLEVDNRREVRKGTLSDSIPILDAAEGHHPHDSEASTRAERRRRGCGSLLVERWQCIATVIAVGRAETR
jgi:hypothetical protein